MNLLKYVVSFFWNERNSPYLKKSLLKFKRVLLNFSLLLRIVLGTNAMFLEKVLFTSSMLPSYSYIVRT